MKRVVRLTESDLARIVKRVIRENDMTEIFGFGKKRKERKEKEGIEDKMREEIRNFNWATPFAEPSQNDRMDGNWWHEKPFIGRRDLFYIENRDGTSHADGQLTFVRHEFWLSTLKKF